MLAVRQIGPFRIEPGLTGAQHRLEGFALKRPDADVLLRVGNGPAGGVLRDRHAVDLQFVVGPQVDGRRRLPGPDGARRPFVDLDLDEPFDERQVDDRSVLDPSRQADPPHEFDGLFGTAELGQLDHLEQLLVERYRTPAGPFTDGPGQPRKRKVLLGFPRDFGPVFQTKAYVELPLCVGQ